MFIEMEQKSRSSILIFLVAVIFSLALGAVHGYSVHLPTRLLEQEVPFKDIGMYLGYVQLVRTAVNPFLIFIGFYLVGRKIVLKANLGLSILSLIAGASIGGLVGYAVTTLIMNPLPDRLGAELLFLAVYPLGSFLQIFFVAFTALAIAHLRKKTT